MSNINEIYSLLDYYFPFCDAEEWDNSGIIVETDRQIKKILVCLDAKKDVIEEAEKIGAELIISHHPVIFNPVSSLKLSEPYTIALKKSTGIISVHTNYDKSSFGADALFSEKLKENLGFYDEEILDLTDQNKGFGRIGKLKKVYSCDEFALKIKEILNCDALRFTKTDRQISKIAFCCGGGSEYLEKAIQLGCDAYITSDVKHSAFTDANNKNIALLSPTHYEMEKPAMNNLCELLKKELKDIDIVLSISESEPTNIL